MSDVWLVLERGFTNFIQGALAMDGQLSAEELDAKYNPEGDGEDPRYSRWDWRQAVAQESTISGYWVWVEHMIKSEGP